MFDWIDWVKLIKCKKTEFFYWRWVGDIDVQLLTSKEKILENKKIDLKINLISNKSEIKLKRIIKEIENQENRLKVNCKIHEYEKNKKSKTYQINGACISLVEKNNEKLLTLECESVKIVSDTLKNITY